MKKETPTTMPYRKPLSDDGRADKKNSLSVASHCVAHHGEFLQGKFKTSDKLQRGLVTVPFNMHFSEAHFQINLTGNGVTVSPPDRTKAKSAAELTLKECGIEFRGGHLIIRSNIPMLLGMGSSTADVVATIIAVAKAHRLTLSAEVIARLAVAAERASDSIMFGNRAVLMAHREGSVIEYFGGPLPHLLILGVNTDTTGRGVNTLALPPAEYNFKEVMEFEVLRAMMRRAIATQSAALIGKVSSASARINQNYLPKPHFDRLERMVEEVGALGLQVAHSGTIAGLIFDPHDAIARERLSLARVRLAELGFSQTWISKSATS
jgi:uncharacterized protein involved in propanediol utilization